MNFTFTSEDEVVLHAQQILAGRAYVPQGARNLMQEDKDSRGKALREYLAVDMAGLPVEHYKAYYFSPDGRLIKDVLISKGDEKTVAAPTREVARNGLLCNATYVVVAHNHPNEDARPSGEDKEAAKQTALGCASVGLQMVAAFVVAGPTADKVVPIPPPKEELGMDDLMEMLSDLSRKGDKRKSH